MLSDCFQIVLEFFRLFHFDVVGESDDEASYSYETADFRSESAGAVVVAFEFCDGFGVFFYQ